MKALKRLSVFCIIFICFITFSIHADAATAKWKLVNGTYYAYSSSGSLIRNKWVGDYYALSNGAMAKNQWIVSTSGTRYFVGENGKWLRNFRGGWYKINKKYYYYTSAGVKRINCWIKYKGNKYYLDANGARAIKWQKIKSKLYYFKKNGKKLSTSWKKSGSWYYPTSSNGKVYKGERMNTASRTTATKIEYRSSSLTAIIQKHTNYNANYWVAQVKVSNVNNQVLGALSYGTFGGTRETTSHAVSRNSAILGINGSRFSYSSGVPGEDAVMLKNGTIYNYAAGTSYNLCLKYDGTLYTPAGGLSASSLKKSGVKDTYSFGPLLISNGSIVNINRSIFSSPEMAKGAKYPRTAVGMISPKNYILLVADGSGLGSGLSLGEMCSIFRSYGCTYAYNLDGGGSVTMSYRGTTLNNANYYSGSERPCGDFMLFKDN